MIKTANGIVSEISMRSYIDIEMSEQFNDGIDTLMLDDKDIKAVRMVLQTHSSLGTA